MTTTGREVLGRAAIAGLGITETGDGTELEWVPATGRGTLVRPGSGEAIPAFTTA